MTQVCLTQSDTAPRYKRPVRPLAKIHRTLFSCKDPKSESVVNRNEKKSVCYPFRKQKGISLHPTIKMSTAELASSYAALILADEGIEITADKLSTIISAAKLEVEPIWTQLFAKALEGKDVKELLLNVGSGSGAAAPAAGGAAASGAAAEDAPAEEKAEEKEESDDDMGFGLFD
ncbi:hypothetical protein D6D19_03845 [Aureobasidium pullulans]|nr:hypothetical protein D6D28_08773 [Aureobasidium pullulans]THV82585.1 hypothetical protein D6D29_04540 [Aureobasidium pullulans]THW75682.1 hypothetical protein D6D19_03845 [Aureobasidium pullulans]THZ23482.1 hypothetical protein D6C91_03646 [Aureobasidium pullulans]THZ51166.1 hypothetical protein D6C90_01971 [Aureobasidium pullulans]